jgi:Holliday junction DNA helicase RuvA
MYNHVRGTLVELSPTRAIIEAGGVGYELFIPLSTYSALQGHRAGAATDGGPAASVFLYAHLLLREELSRLYGFATEAERRVFRMIIGVSGLGPSIAIAMLSSIPVGELRTVIDAGDATPLLAIRGVGKKLASRILLELRDRVDELPGAEALSRRDGRAPAGADRSAVASEAALALVELGFSRPEAEDRVRKVLESLEVAARRGDDTAAGARITVEAVVRESLRGV